MYMYAYIHTCVCVCLCVFAPKVYVCIESCSVIQPTIPYHTQIPYPVSDTILYVMPSHTICKNSEIKAILITQDGSGRKTTVLAVNLAWLWLP